jgi:RNA polymerase sigma factor (sigma-70 family)
MTKTNDSIDAALWVECINEVEKLHSIMLQAGELIHGNRHDSLGEGYAAIPKMVETWDPKRCKLTTYIWTCARRAFAVSDRGYRSQGFTGDRLFTQRLDGEDKLQEIGTFSETEIPCTEEDMQFHDYEQQELRRMVALLPEKQKHMIEMVYFMDLPMQEAALQLGLSRRQGIRVKDQGLHQLRSIYDALPSL